MDEHVFLCCEIHCFLKIRFQEANPTYFFMRRSEASEPYNIVSAQRPDSQRPSWHVA